MRKAIVFVLLVVLGKICPNSAQVSVPAVDLIV
ncbi:MAG: hypothetical protein CM15mP71_0780 [Candidatus Poseidoniales archaeon]|nr:MAG: hypothetical protein CM15mP71_0780 [Candidatus Poseidoniales archaeon]